MAFSGFRLGNFQTGILLRLVGLQVTLALLAWMVTHTDWYVTMSLCTAALVMQVLALGRYSARTGREMGRFLDAIAFDDTSAGFAGLSRDKDFSELGHAMTRVLEQLRGGRMEREEQSQYLQSLLAHVPVSLISVDQNGRVHLLNLAARRLFAGPCDSVEGFVRHGASFAAGLEALKPGQGAIVRMERAAGALQLKAAATDLVLGGLRRRLISLQNIESELNAQELVAWEAVIRVVAHEVMNSLTPISSLAGTARDRVRESLSLLPPEHAAHAGLDDAVEALDTLARRSDGLLHFVQNHRRLTRRMVAQTSIMPMRRVFTRLQRLLADELKTRDIALTARVEPETLEITADADLIDQALINLVRNAMDALRDTTQGRIILSAVQDSAGRPVITVADNGPGIPMDQREKVFVPFYTTKRQGSGVGLTLVRQIASVHDGMVSISESPGGGAAISITL
jgi:two-component system, NtrC family, nitrogen regulation sensor histidine kinase NtrY